MLEIGAGTGRVAVALAEQGLTVTGVDPSEAMLERARDRVRASRAAASSVTLHQASMLDLTVEGRFRLAIVPYGTFQHILKQEEQIAALKRIGSHLEPGAGLVIDQGNPLGALLAEDLPVMTHERTFPDPETGDDVMQQSLRTIDRTTQIETITWVYDRMGSEGRLYRQISRMELRHTLAPEMRLLLSLSGFHDAELYGDYDFSPYDENCPRLFVVATRGNAAR